MKCKVVDSKNNTVFRGTDFECERFLADLKNDDNGFWSYSAGSGFAVYAPNNGAESKMYTIKKDW